MGADPLAEPVPHSLRPFLTTTASWPMVEVSRITWPAEFSSLVEAHGSTHRIIPCHTLLAPAATTSGMGWLAGMCGVSPSHSPSPYRQLDTRLKHCPNIAAMARYSHPSLPEHRRHGAILPAGPHPLRQHVTALSNLILYFCTALTASSRQPCPYTAPPPSLHLTTVLAPSTAPATQRARHSLSPSQPHKSLSARKGRVISAFSKNKSAKTVTAAAAASPTPLRPRGSALSPSRHPPPPPSSPSSWG